MNHATLLGVSWGATEYAPSRATHQRQASRASVGAMRDDPDALQVMFLRSLSSAVRGASCASMMNASGRCGCCHAKTTGG